MGSSNVAANSNEFPAVTHSSLQCQRECWSGVKRRLTPVYTLITPGTKHSSSYTAVVEREPLIYRLGSVSAFKLDRGKQSRPERGSMATVYNIKSKRYPLIF